MSSLSHVLSRIRRLWQWMMELNTQWLVKLASFVVFLWFIWKNRARKHPTIPLRPGWLPIIGHLHHMTGLMAPKGVEPLDATRDVLLATREDVLYVTRFGNFQCILLFEPKYIKFVFEDQFDAFVKGKSVRDRLFELLGDGIFASDGEVWRKHRKIGSKMFSMRNLKNYMFEVAKRGNDRWMAKLEQLRQSEHAIDIYDLLAVYTLDVFVEIAFGETLQIIEAIPAPHPFSVAFDSALNLIPWRFRLPFFPVLKFLSIGHEARIKHHVKEVDKFAHEMIDLVQQNKGKLADETGAAKHNILSLFLQENPNLSANELRDIAMNFIIAGRDTTRILLSWFLYELSLSHNQHISEKIVQEIDCFYQHEQALNYQNIQNHYGAESDSATHVSYFKYLEAALLETLRLHPAVPFLLRYAVRDVTLPGTPQHKIYKGQAVAVNTYIQGHNTRVWGDDAAVFKPERFLQHGLKTFEPHVYLAFNISPRLCLGRHVAIMEAKLVVIQLLHKYRFEAVKNQKVAKQPGLVLNMKNGFKIQLFVRREV